MCKVFSEKNIFFFSDKDYPDIKHSFDIWHGSKNLGKKLLKVLAALNIFIYFSGYFDKFTDLVLAYNCL